MLVTRQTCCRQPAKSQTIRKSRSVDRSVGSEAPMLISAQQNCKKAVMLTGVNNMSSTTVQHVQLAERTHENYRMTSLITTSAANAQR